MTRAFITGVGGQDGTLLARNLIADGQEVHGMVQPGHSASNLPEGVALHEGDLGNPEGVSELIHSVAPQVIYNLGGISSVGYSWEQPALTGRISGQGAVEVFEAAWRLQEETGSPVAVIQASSAEVFGSPTHSPQTEDTPLAPVSPYGAAKAYAQNLAASYRAKGLPITSLILYAHESTLRPPTFVTRKITTAAARIAVEGGGTVSLGNLDAVRDWGWAPDYVVAMQKAAQELAAGDLGTEYVVATGIGHTVEDFVATAFAAVGISQWQDHVRIDPEFFRPADPALLVGDAAKIRERLGWAPALDFAQVVQTMCDYDLQQVKAKSGA